MDELVAARPVAKEPLRVVDVGCGCGDTLRRVHAWAAKRGISVRLIGIDLNPDAIRAAKEATSPALGIEWIVGDALHSDRSVDEIDVVICTLDASPDRSADCEVFAVGGEYGETRVVCE